MKEKYVKPAMIIERFEMTSSIAKNCANLDLAGRPTSNDVKNCKWEFAPGFYLFLDVTGCEVPVIEGKDQGFGYICYNNPTDSATIFSS